MNRFDPAYGERLMAHLDGEASMGVLAGLDDAARRELDALREVHDALHREGDAAVVPVVDLWTGIAGKLDAALDDEPRMVSALMELGDAFRRGVPEANLFDGAPADMVDEVPLEVEAALEAAAEKRAPEVLVDLWPLLSQALPEEDEPAVEPALEAALFSLGAEITSRTPDANLWEALCQRAEWQAAPGGQADADAGADAAPGADATAPSHNIVPFPVEKPQEEMRRSRWWVRAAGYAAAAALLLFIGNRLDFGLEKPSENRMTQSGAALHGEAAIALARVADEESPEGEGVMRLRPSVSGGALPPGPRSRPANRPRPVTLKEVVEAYRSDADDLSRFGSWASLTREEAAALLEQSGLSREALIGAAQFLDPEDALVVLQAAVDNAPDDPYLRYALANAYGDTADVAGYQRALEEWREADPQNAMPYYLQAQMMLASGDMAGATASINAGTQLPGAALYGAESARYRAAAHEASGKQADAARFLAAATAGSEEYAALRSVGNDLMDQARRLEDSGQLEAAADLYDAIRVLGEQAMAAADVPQVQLVALEIQQDAVSHMMALQEVWTPDTVAALASMADAVLAGINELTTLLGDVSNFLSSNNLQQVLDITNSILSGDLGTIWNLTSR